MNKQLLIGLIMAICLVSNVLAIGSINIVDTTISLSAAPGASASTTMQVSNTGTETFNSVALSVTDLTGPATLSASQVVLSPSPLALLASSSENPTVQVTVPSTQKAGTYTGTITAEHNSTNKDTASLQVTVDSVQGLSASANAVEFAQGSAGQLTINVQNNGNYDATGVSWQVTTTPTTGSATLTPAANSGSMNVPYGGSQEAILLFNVGATQAAGTYSGVVTITWGSATAQVPITITVRAPQYSVSVPDVTFPEGDVDDEVDAQVTITNDGDYPLTGVMLETDNNAVEITSGTVPTTLSVGQSFTVTLTYTIDDNIGGGTNDIGNLEFSSNEISKDSDLMIDIGNKLDIDRVKMSFDDSSWDTINDGENYDEDQVRPGSKFEMTVKLENLFDDNSNIDMDDIEIEVLMEGMGEDGDDIEGDVDSFGINAGDKSEDVNIDFDYDMIGWDVDSGKHDVTIEVTGIDDNDGDHSANFSFTLDVNRDRKGFFVFDRFDATPTTVQCGQTVRVYVDGNSIGEKGEDQTQLKITSSVLDINDFLEFAIGAYDEDDCDALDPDEDGQDCNQFSYAKSFIVPKNIASGSYPIKGELFNNAGDDKTDEETVMIQVTCGSSSSSSSSGSSESTTSTTSSSSGSTTTTSSSSGSTTTQPTTTQPKPASQSGSVAVYYGGAGSGTQNPNIVSATPTKIKDLSDKNVFGSDVFIIGLMSIVGVILLVLIIGLIVWAATRK